MKIEHEEEYINLLKEIESYKENHATKKLYDFILENKKLATTIFVIGKAYAVKKLLKGELYNKLKSLEEEFDKL